MAATKPGTSESSEKPSGRKLVPQPHGGALVPGAGGGPQPGSGRPPAQFRELARQVIHNRNLLERLGDIADASIGEIKHEKVDGVVVKTYCETPIREQRGAIETLLKYGVGESKELSAEKIRDRLSATIEAIRDLIPEEQAVPLLERMRSIWR